MGFNRGSKVGAPERKGHRWINYPNKAHQKCTKCGCKVDKNTINGIMLLSYTDITGNKLNECPNCI